MLSIIPPLRFYNVKDLKFSHIIQMLSGSNFAKKERDETKKKIDCSNRSHVLRGDSEMPCVQCEGLPKSLSCVVECNPWVML